MRQSEDPVSGHLMDLPPEEVPGLPGIEKRIVFGPERFWEDYVMRCFTIHPGGRVPLHHHEWPHYILVLQGRAAMTASGEEREIAPFSWAHVPPGSEHAFQPAGEEPLVFICIVPREGDQPPKS